MATDELDPPRTPDPVAGDGRELSSHGLHANTLSTYELLAQSVAGIAPSAVMATGPALVALGAGDSVLYSYVASTIVMVLVGWCISQFAKREGEDGTLLTYVRRAFGPAAGFISAVALSFGYLCIAIACIAGIVMYAAPLVALVGISDGTAYAVIIAAVVMVLAIYTMIRGVHLSTRIGMALEILSILAILAVLVAVLAKFGLNAGPLEPADLGISGVTGGMVLAILGYVGFESAANLGTEAKDQAHSVPKAVIGSALVVGVLYLFSAYAELLGFGGGAGLSASAAPLNDLATNAGVSPLGYLVDIGAVASFFACITGSLNAASRLAFQIAEEGFLPTSFGRAHPAHMTPHRSIVLLGAIAAVLAIVTLPWLGPLQVFGVFGTIGTYGYMVSYILVSFGVIRYLAQRRANLVLPTVIGVVAGGALIFVLVRNVYPAPDFPYNLLPWIFLALLMITAAWYVVGARRGSKEVGSHIS